MNNLDFLKGSGNVIIFYPSIANMVGSINAGLLLCQFFFYTQERPDEEIFVSHNRVKKTIGLTRTQFENARKLLIDLGIIEVYLKGMPARNCYRVNWENLEVKFAEYQQSCSQQTRKQGSGEPTTLFAENQQSINSTGNSKGSGNNINKKYRKKEDGQIFMEKNYGPCMDLYFKFFKEVLLLPRPKVDAGDGKALKSLINHLGSEDWFGQNDPEKLQAFLWTVFNNWNKLPTFYRSMITLKQINSKFTELVHQLKLSGDTANIKPGSRNDLINYAKEVNKAG